MKSRRPLEDNRLSPWRFVKSRKMKTLLLARQYLDNVKRKGNLVSIRDLRVGLREGLSLDDGKISAIGEKVVQRFNKSCGQT